MSRRAAYAVLALLRGAVAGLAVANPAGRRHCLALLVLLLVLGLATTSLPPLRTWTALETILAVRRARAASAALPDEARLFRGQPPAYWRQRLKERKLRFSHIGALWIQEDDGKSIFLAPSKEVRRDVTPLFVTLLNDPEPGVRAQAAIGLGSFGQGDEAVLALVEALRDENDHVRYEAAWWLDAAYRRQLTAAERDAAAFALLSPGPPEVISGRMEVLDLVTDGLRQYRKEAGCERRLRWLKQLAPTCDPRVAVELGGLLEAWPAGWDRRDRKAAVALAVDLLGRYYIPSGVLTLERSRYLEAVKWWHESQDDLRRQAERLRPSAAQPRR